MTVHLMKNQKHYDIAFWPWFMYCSFLTVMLVELIPPLIIIYNHVGFISTLVIWTVAFLRTSYWAFPQQTYCHIYLKFDLTFSAWCSQGFIFSISSDFSIALVLIPFHVTHFKVNAQRLSILMNVSSDVCLQRNASLNALSEWSCFIKTMLESGSVSGPQTMCCRFWQKLVWAEEEKQQCIRYAHTRGGVSEVDELSIFDEEQLWVLICFQAEVRLPVRKWLSLRIE